MWKLHSDFEEQSSNCTDLRMKLSEAGKLQEQLNKMEEDLLKQREETKTLQRAPVSHQAQLDLLETERLHLQQAKTSLLEEIEKSRVCHEVQQENNSFVPALKKAEQSLENHHIQYRSHNAFRP